MRNASVLYLVLHVTHDAKCFSVCVYSHLDRQLPDNFTPSQKYQLMGRMSIKKRDRAPGLIENKASLILTWFNRFQSLHLKMSVISIFTLVGRGFSTKYCVLHMS